MRESELSENFEQYARYLQDREGFRPGAARMFARRIQNFYRSGKPAKEYAEQLYNNNKDWAASFLSNYGLYNQFLSSNLFCELMPLRRELRQRQLNEKA